MHPMLNIAIQAARNAARIIVHFIDRLDVVEIREKNRNDFVTQVDQLSEKEIIHTIRKAYPDHTILAEESGLHKFRDDFVWIIDPLDGTTNFIHGVPQMAISIALKYRNELVIAVIYDPLYQELFTAVRGNGAQLNNRRIRVSSCMNIDKALIGTNFPLKRTALSQTYNNFLETVVSQTIGIRHSGVAALDLAYVASGRLDGCWEIGLKPWDIAAGILLIIESGGFVCDFQGGSDYMKGNIITGNAKIHKFLLGLLLKTENDSK
ncbi:inositol monophosphatase family protein [Coxiella endosymbiont of Amblyomma americanum]|uniref:inositol monophosphatase family protein n=1 Tax=Coxiella endosymbiont of Amblyomma americanum TaxID=325775 RepID=UPI00057F228B|nr:inositol monophosphatase family protein [Coxiella endosymbiont of Amblyomma americanum]AJC50597.1 inositol monophosphatase [Coxiella endosymbiont of Amblyomma americanum]AUJ59060.1 inositol monophosphatase [Coxiella-like endosymbiont of Amblyomma americanum]